MQEITISKSDSPASASTPAGLGKKFVILPVKLWSLT